MEKIKISDYKEAFKKYLNVDNATEEFDWIIKSMLMDHTPDADETGLFVTGDAILCGRIGDAIYILTGESGNNLLNISGFARQVRKGWSQWHEQYIEKCAMGVVSGEYDSISPAAGSDIFYIRKSGDAVIASTRPNGENELRIFELIG